MNSTNDKPDRPEFRVTDLLHSCPLTLHNGRGEIELVKKSKRRQDNGKWGREFLQVQIKTGPHRVMYLDPNVARQVYEALGDMLPKIVDEEHTQQAKKEAAEAAWQADISTGNGAARKTRRTGKTERKRKAAAAAGRPVDSTKKKAEKAERDREIRARAQGKKS